MTARVPEHLFPRERGGEGGASADGAASQINQVLLPHTYARRAPNGGFANTTEKI